MIQELHYTSAPRGLKPGSRGFCTVATTPQMPGTLIERLESLSGYRQIFPPSDPSAARNPVNHSHLRLVVAGAPRSVVSRIGFAGLDYTDRANKYAHHVVLDTDELPTGGPAWLLDKPGFMQAAWEGEPRILEAGRMPPRGDRAPGVARAWEDRVGDAGWAGVLAEAFLADPKRPAYLIFDPGMDLLPLIVEAIALIPPARRWDVTFSTYFTGLSQGISCAWRCVLRDSPEAQQALRLTDGLAIDLGVPPGRAEGGDLVRQARTGEPPSVLAESEVRRIARPRGGDEAAVKAGLPPTPILPTLTGPASKVALIAASGPPNSPTARANRRGWKRATAVAVLVVGLAGTAAFFYLRKDAGRPEGPSRLATQARPASPGRGQKPRGIPPSQPPKPQIAAPMVPATPENRPENLPVPLINKEGHTPDANGEAARHADPKSSNVAIVPEEARPPELKYQPLIRPGSMAAGQVTFTKYLECPMKNSAGCSLEIRGFSDYEVSDLELEYQKGENPRQARIRHLPRRPSPLISGNVVFLDFKISDDENRIEINWADSQQLPLPDSKRSKALQECILRVIRPGQAHLDFLFRNHMALDKHIQLKHGNDVVLWGDPAGPAEGQKLKPPTSKGARKAGVAKDVPPPSPFLRPISLRECKIEPAPELPIRVESPPEEVIKKIKLHGDDGVVITVELVSDDKEITVTAEPPLVEVTSSLSKASESIKSLRADIKNSDDNPPKSDDSKVQDAFMKKLKGLNSDLRVKEEEKAKYERIKALLSDLGGRELHCSLCLKIENEFVEVGRIGGPLKAR